VCQCILAIDDEEEHASHFWIRELTSDGMRPVEKYLAALPKIRRIQNYLVDCAGKEGIPVVQNSRMEDAIDAVIELVLAKLEHARALA
jgi:2-phosphoglycerate kinase